MQQRRLELLRNRAWAEAQAYAHSHYGATTTLSGLGSPRTIVTTLEDDSSFVVVAQVLSATGAARDVAWEVRRDDAGHWEVVTTPVGAGSGSVQR